MLDIPLNSKIEFERETQVNVQTAFPANGPVPAIQERNPEQPSLAAPVPAVQGDSDSFRTALANDFQSSQIEQK